jgi:CheY-like chemotaxis protein
MPPRLQNQCEQFGADQQEAHLYTLGCMAANSTLLCIHRDPAQLSLLEENGYELVTATNGCDGLRLFMSRPVDAIVLEYHLGLLDGAVVAAEIKKVNPQLPIVMLNDHAELPDGAWKSVDALVINSDGPHFLLATIHFVLNVKPAQPPRGSPRIQTSARRSYPARSRKQTSQGHTDPPPLATDGKAAPFSPRMWRSIRNGSIQF